MTIFVCLPWVSEEDIPLPSWIGDVTVLFFRLSILYYLTPNIGWEICICSKGLELSSL